MNVERLLPADAVRPLWSSASALVYLGGITTLIATGVLIGIVADDGGDWAAVGVALVAAVLAFAIAEVLAGADRAIAAGVAATLAVSFAAGCVAAVLEAIGALGVDIRDWQPFSLVVEAVLIGAALLAIRRYRAPLLVLPGALAFWVAVADLGSLATWDDADELLSIAVGAVLVTAGVVVDRAGRRPFAFWLHAVGGVAVGGGITALAGDSAWPLIALFAAGYVALAFTLERSSYAVLGALGILIVATIVAIDFSTTFAVFPFGAPARGDSLEDWEIALSYVVAGLLIAGIGVAGRIRWPDRAGPDA